MKRVAIKGYTAFASGVPLTACLPVILDKIQGNPILQTPVLDLSPSAVFTTSPTSTATIESTSTASPSPASQFTPILICYFC